MTDAPVTRIKMYNVHELGWNHEAAALVPMGRELFVYRFLPNINHLSWQGRKEYLSGFLQRVPAAVKGNE